MQRFAVFAFVLAVLVATPFEASAQTPTPRVQARITQAVNENQLTRLAHNTHPLARSEFNQGAAAVDLPMEHMLLVLNRSSEQQAALETLLAQQQDKSSPQYHKWLTPQQFGQQFGAADQDVQTITAWLEANGFQVNSVSQGKTVIDFSGTAGQVQNAFHTEIHKYVLNGVEHWANASDPQIPAALAPVVAGVATLHTFYKKPQLAPLNRQIPFTYTPGSKPQYTVSVASQEYALAPGDYATIYNINPLYQAGINGTGTTIAVVAQSNLAAQGGVAASDVVAFRSMFGLPANAPNIIVNGTNPGVVSGDAEEATLDATWAGVIAPNAAVDLVVSASTNTTSGVDLSELYIIDNNLADVMTESYGDCEANYTQAEANYYSSLAQQAAAEGITYTVAAGDSGAEGCDDPNSELTATGPVSVNILAATPYNIAVGGTEFNENGNYSAYWNSSNASSGGSALSYIPEDAWNESCTVAQCGSANAGIWAGGGGASTLFTKPTWQTGVAGIPNDGARDVPDVSLTAASHDFYLLCFQNSCTSRRGRSFFSGVSGTSAPTPSFAGILALLVQKTGSRQGQAAPVFYALAASESLASCNASNTSGLPASNCIFNDVTVGNNAVPGENGYGTSTADYQAGAGYDLATGLGSVNVTNLINSWNGAPTVAPVYHVVIEQPGSQNSTYIGLSVFSGYAVNSSASITSVEASIDGVPYGPATYGLSRSDVCALYPAGINCPNVGWSFTVDTTSIADGTHTLDVTASSTLGDHFTVSGSFTAANWSTADPVVVDIDTPSSKAGPYSGTVGFGGWALNNAGAVNGVSIAVDGVPYGNASYGSSRTDVCAVYPNRANCPNVGWNLIFDTTVLADGTHTIAVTGFTTTGQNTTVTTTFTTANLAGNKIRVNIDRPTAQSAPFSGAASFGGWALDTTSGVSITNVSVAVDGVSQGNAVYGGARTDVCAVYVGSVGCPNVGWNFVLDTLTLANGTHTLEITATASNGQKATAGAPFAVANTTAGLPLKMFIDTPGAQNAIVTGLTGLAGWAIDDNGAITSVAISIDGAPRGNAIYGANRQDVCAAYPGRAGCPNVGWSMPLDTTLLPDGTHTLAVTASSVAGDQLTVSGTFTVANWTTGNPMRVNIDNPNAQSGAFSGVVGFGGWAIDDTAAITNVAIAVDGVSFGNANYGGARSDVCTAYPGRAGCPNVGWNAAIDTTLLANGTHTLAVTGTSSGGQHTTVTQTFTVSNSTTGPVVITIDQPSPSAPVLTGTGQLLGWALDTTSGVGIASVQVLVDGVSYGNATYGVQRPDVCAAYPGEVGCPNVGWTYSLDTTVLANGKHTLQIRAVSTTGQQATLSSSFNVSNVL